MTEDRKDQRAAENKRETMDVGDRHVGRTLESEGIFENVSGTELPPVADANASAGDENVDSVGIRKMGDAALDMPTVSAGDVSDVDSDAALENFPGTLRSRPEELKTRLPGDTSSDPHTDAGPENATTAHGRTDEAA